MRIRSSIAFIAAVLALTAGAVPMALAATFTVSKVADTNDGVCDADCSLREAVVAANAAGGSNDIMLDPTLGTYTLSIFPAGADTADSGDLDITGGVIAIHGNGATIHGGGDRIFEVKPGGTLTLDNATVEGGFASCGFSDAASGAGILNSGTLSLSRVTIRNNTSGCGVGGGVANDFSSTATIDLSTISGNSANRGGGVGNVGSGHLTITGSTISDNQAGSGGGVYNAELGNSQNRLTITASTIARNTGGGLFNAGATTLTNVTIADNRGVGQCQAGGITNGQCGSGIVGPVVFVRNSIIAHNTAFDPINNDCFDWFNSVSSDRDRHNVVGTAGGCQDLREEIVDPDPKLGSLGSFGGPTQTIPLLSGSPAIDAGNSTYFRGTDQRGIAMFGIASDIGAFERVPGAVAAFTVSNANPVDGQIVTFTSTSSTTNVGATLSYHWDFGDGATSTAANPTHAFSAATSPVTYTVTLQVVDTSLSADQTSQSITANPAMKLAVTQQPGNAFLGGAFGDQPVVQVQDNAGNLLTTSTAAVTAAVSTGPGLLGGTTTVNAVGGVVTFTNLQISLPGHYVLQFTAPGVSSTFSNAFDVLGSTVEGHVYSGVVPVANALVQVCQGTSCRYGTTDASGKYSVPGVVPGTVQVSAFPPSIFVYGPATIAPFTVAGSGAVTTGHDLNLPALSGPPAGTTLSPSSGSSSPGVPTVFWSNVLTLQTTGQCGGGTAAYEITVGGVVAAGGGMTESPAGTYTATVSPLSPAHGVAHVKITINCPGAPSPLVIPFDIYIDPSGVVQRPNGTPIAGATVTLFRLDDEGGFVRVPDGSAIMSPSNRRNPDLTNARGQFGWDTLGGTYKVRAAKAGCFSPSESSFAEAGPFSVPPPKADIVLVLECPSSDNTPPVIAAHPDVHVVTHDTHATSVVVTYAAPDVTDDVDATHPADCSPAPGSSFPVGHTPVRCSAIDAAGNQAVDTFFDVFVEFVDTTPPVIAAHPDVHVVTHDAHATSVVVTYTAPDVTDDVDATHPASCSPASGSSFLVGVHTRVTCSAADHAGNHAIDTFFDVFVELVASDPVALLNQLAADVNAASNLKKGLRSDLVESLDATVKALSKRPPRVKSACENLDDFIDQLREKAGKQGLTAAQAAAWIARAHSIEALIGCTPGRGEGDNDDQHGENQQNGNHRN